MSFSLPFSERLENLPQLGLGISTEFGARNDGLDVLALHRDHPELCAFLEIGCDLERGLDEDALAWVKGGAPVTYHFLDLNLEEGATVPSAWIAETKDLVDSVNAAWVCGDAGLWHLGPRDRGHETLMPPILCAESADLMSESIVSVRAGLGKEVLPENPPAHVYLGDMHLLEYFGRVLEQADTGMLLDVSHLAVYQKVMGYEALDGLDDFPLDRVIEVHIAGGRPFEFEGKTFFEDDHGTTIVDEAWLIYDEVLRRAKNLKAVAFECEHNQVEEVVPIFHRLAEGLEALRS